MEKRILLAFILSFSILSAWNYFFSPPKKSVVHSQVIDTKEVKEIKTTDPAASSSTPVVDSNLAIKEEITQLNNDFLSVDLSNIGPSINKITIKEFDITLPVTNIALMSLSNIAHPLLTDHGPDYAIYSSENENFKVLSKFFLEAHKYKINVTFQVINKSSSQQDISIGVNNFSLDNTRLDKEIENSPNKSLLEYSVATTEKTFRKGNAYKFSSKENIHEAKSVRWVGFRDRYFSLVTKSSFPAVEYNIKVQNERNLSIDVHSGSTTLASGEAKEYGFEIYYGPQKLGVLKSHGADFAEIMAFSNWGVIDAIGKGINFVFESIHKVVPNLGVCIIIISSLIYLLTYPLTFQSMLSMKKMQAIQPQLTKLREQHQNNPQKLNKEMMELYKKNNVNPISGCLPIFLQMPIFIGLYQVLWRSVSFKRAGFLWIKDLSEPDRLMTFKTHLPVIGNELNILPILMMIVMFFQQKISAKNMVVTDPSQAAQQKMMQTLMPLMIGFLFYKFASGLSLYFTVFYLLSTLSQWKMSKLKVS